MWKNTINNTKINTDELPPNPSYTITKRSRVPLKKSLAEELVQLNQRPPSQNSANTNNSANDKSHKSPTTTTTTPPPPPQTQPQQKYEFNLVEVNRDKKRREIELQKHKKELDRIVNEEEALRKQSLLNLRQELDSMESCESLDTDEYRNNHITTRDLRIMKPTLSRDLSNADSSLWTTDEEGGGVGGGGGSSGVGGTKKRRKKYSRRRRNTFTDEELERIPRLVHRNMPFKQSRQEIAVVNKTVFRGLKVQRILSQVRETRRERESRF